ncbi:MAG: SDR family oxidoreductase [Desulfobacterales bacterium]|nr:SDR family oxidoreductase [Desulfobacterales bacterium]
MLEFDSDMWALIIGGSSGFGLATAQKLARHGMNLCIVHRDRRGALNRIQSDFDELKRSGIKVRIFNLDALSDQGRTTVLNDLAADIGQTGRVKLLLHSIAFGNLKLLVPSPPTTRTQTIKTRMSEKLKLSQEDLNKTVDELFIDGCDSLYPIATPPVHQQEMFLKQQDFTHTIHAMGSNILEWVQDVHERKFFANDARIIGLTSEGNSTVWKGYAAVSAAKAVLESVSRAMAVEFAPYGLRSNIIQAGVTDTPALRLIPGNQHIKANARLRNPFNRLTTPADVANVIFLLCLDEAAWINGSLIHVDGGEHIA